MEEGSGAELKTQPRWGSPHQSPGRRQAQAQGNGLFSPPSSSSLHFCLISKTHIFLLHAPGLGGWTAGQPDAWVLAQRKALAWAKRVWAR